VPAAAGEFALKDIFTRSSEPLGFRAETDVHSFRLLRTSRTALISAVVVCEARVEHHDDLVPVSESMPHVTCELAGGVRHRSTGGGPVGHRRRRQRCVPPQWLEPNSPRAVCSAVGLCATVRARE
jgi:hypothetical protein